MSHSCLKPEQVVALIQSELHYPESFPAVLFQLARCPNCWGAIDRLRGQPITLPDGLLSPFKALFISLVTQEGHTASHRKVLSKVREDGIEGLYRLLLEEGVAYLPAADFESGRYTLLRFDMLLDRLSTSRKRHDLAAHLSVLAALFWAYYRARDWSLKHFERASQRRLKGTGDPELHATILGAEAELSPSLEETSRKMTRALGLLVDFPERRVELLFQFGHKLILLGEPLEAWERLIEAEQLAESHFPCLLPPIRSELLVLESSRGRTAPEPAERLFYQCLFHHHVRGVQGDAQAPATGQGDAISEFATLCLALAAGQTVPDAVFAEAVRVVHQGAPGLNFLEGFFTRVHALKERFPEGRLARELLLTLLGHMQQEAA